jgi:hypothetical protein
VIRDDIFSASPMPASRLIDPGGLPRFVDRQHRLFDDNLDPEMIRLAERREFVANGADRA